VQILARHDGKPHHLSPSWPGLTRPSTNFLDDLTKDVDARDERGHDALGQEGQRVQRKVVAYAQMSQAAMRSTKIVVESIAHMKEKERLR
jgi:hypothetical protein